MDDGRQKIEADVTKIVIETGRETGIVRGSK
jgi:hypothetical protein